MKIRNVLLWSPELWLAFCIITSSLRLYSLYPLTDPSTLALLSLIILPITLIISVAIGFSSIAHHEKTKAIVVLTTIHTLVLAFMLIGLIGSKLSSGEWITITM
ncbi:MAG: hypothetical protein V4519_02985 [Patescibacteria group bacterium]